MSYDVEKEQIGLTLQVEMDEVINYAIQQNSTEIIRNICIKNNSDREYDNLCVHIDTNTDLFDLLEIGVEKVRAGEEIHLSMIKIKINGEYLASLTERKICTMIFSIYFNDQVLFSEKKDIIALAFDQWPGLKYTPELLAAFSMPNHPMIVNLIQLASQYLKKWTTNPSLAGYQFDDPNRVKQMAAAAFAAIQQKNITYANPPSSFEEFGQRIRLADAVLEQHLGTCMDMTLLYVACLEAMGLNPIMILVRGHIFAGVWLVDDSFSDMIMDDPSHLEKRMAAGIGEILVVECTAMCAGKTRSFDEAVNMAERKVSDYSDFEFVIDVTRARSMGIRPLPIRIMTNNGFEIKYEERKEVTNAPLKMETTFDLHNLNAKQNVTKQMQWERKLLDLSMRNMLINLRFTKAVVPLLCSNVSSLEDELVDGQEFYVMPRPDNMEIKGDGLQVEALTDLGVFHEFMELECKHKKLHSLYTEKELSRCLTKMYRSAKTSMEENGASTLYLVLGLLRWIEEKKDAVVRYAPIILLPIDITRKSGNKGYALSMRDEEAQINITLLEFLKQNYDVKINGLSPLPTDEHGLDLPKIFAIIRHAVMNLPMWDVLEAGFIGNFSFSQFVMWNDIHSRSDMLERSNIARSLIKGHVDWDCSIPEGVDTEEAYLPITADASQLRAINMAVNGISFVLHGPPGTGKSQTITAMISNALTRGKTVLFVAEKKAALEVVQRRLSALGIGDFCLELHSNKATKKAVFDQLKKILEINAYGKKTEYNEKIVDIRKMRKELDSYVDKLHVKRSVGKSLKELIDIYETIPEYDKELRFFSEEVETLTLNELERQKRLLEQLVAVGKAVGHPHNHPLSAVKQTIYTQTLKMDLLEAISNYRKAIQEIKDSSSCFVDELKIENPVSKTQWEKLYLLAQSVIGIENVPEFLFQIDNLDREFDFPIIYAEEREHFLQKKNELLQNWKEAFLYTNMEMYRTKYDEANKKILGKGKALKLLLAEIQSFARINIEVEHIPSILAEMELLQKEDQKLKDMKEQLSFAWRQILNEKTTYDEVRKYKEDLASQLSVVSEISEAIKKLQKENTWQKCISDAKMLVQKFNNLQEIETKVQQLLLIEFNEESAWIDESEKLCECLTVNADVIKDWIVYRQVADACKKDGLEIVCDAYEEGLPHEQLINVYLKSIYKAIILSIIENEPSLNGFTGSSFNEKIVQFKNLDEQFMELTKEEMYYKLSHNLPSMMESVEISKELNILRRAISSNGRGISIRTLFEQIPVVLKKLCPCMLMSPISVAQYLSADVEPYDIVIFDEASQLPTCKAVGVLARGKSAVIVGDPNQMPPTSFFAGNSVDEDNLDIEDLDSILDDCLALGMPSAHLQWHYRSRHESLIAFSNHEFYENTMITFPSVNDREKKVHLVKVEGCFDRKKGRINEEEAKAIVGEIRRRYADQELKKQSIGVVTFNISQQMLIEDMLQEEYEKDLDFDHWANSSEESLFVKNLENVQGDERDVILFSIAFGPNEEGKLSLNFGPLNKEGGWKRLNVAVSRARLEMLVFSIMTADMIDLKRTKSKGVEALKDFLEFAAKGEIHGSYLDSYSTKKQGTIDKICMEIEKAGYKYQTEVGHSRFKMDIAVLNPYNEKEYLMGIMLDGESYRQSINTKDREVAQIEVLKGLGWKLHRIWTLDWWDNKQKELDKLFSLLQIEKEKAYEKAGKPQVQMTFERKMVISNKDKTEMSQEIKIAGKPEKVSSSVFVEQERNYITEEYQQAKSEITPLATTEYIQKNHIKEIVEKAQQLINVEAPISHERLVKKILHTFDISRSSAATIETTEKALKKVVAKTNKQNGVKFYWRKDQDPNTYYVYRLEKDSTEKRNLDEVCQQELKNAICVTLMKNGSLDKEELIKKTIRTMGYSRSGNALIDAVQRGLKFGRKTGEIIVDDNKKFNLVQYEGADA